MGLVREEDGEVGGEVGEERWERRGGWWAC
jgi:hypothetical protein